MHAIYSLSNGRSKHVYKGKQVYYTGTKERNVRYMAIVSDYLIDKGHDELPYDIVVFLDLNTNKVLKYNDFFEMLRKSSNVVTKSDVCMNRLMGPGGVNIKQIDEQIEKIASDKRAKKSATKSSKKPAKKSAKK